MNQSIEYLKKGQLVSHGGLKGRIVKRCKNQEGEWYWVEIYCSIDKRLWKIRRDFLELR